MGSELVVFTNNLVMNLSHIFHFCSILSIVLVSARAKYLRNAFEETDTNQDNVLNFQELKNLMDKVNSDFSAGQWNQKKPSQSTLLPAGQGRWGKTSVLKTGNTNSIQLVNQKWKTPAKRKLGRHGRTFRAEIKLPKKIGLPHLKIGQIGDAGKPQWWKGRAGGNRGRIENRNGRNGGAAGNRAQGNEIWLANSGVRGAEERGITGNRGKNQGQGRIKNGKKERGSAHNRVGRVDKKKGSTNRQRSGKHGGGNRFWKGKLVADIDRKGKVKAVNFRKGKVKAGKGRKHKGGRRGQPRMQGNSFKGQSNKGRQKKEKRRQGKRMQGNKRFGKRRQRSNWKRPGNRLKGV